jgi:plastocyanin
MCFLVLIAVLGGCSKKNAAEVATPPLVSETPATPVSPAPSTSAPSAQPSSVAKCDDRSSGAMATVQIRDFAFDTKCFSVEPGQGLSLHNNGQVLHNFSVEKVAGIDVDIQPGQTNNTEATNLDPGTYTFFCKYHRDRGMEGQLQVNAP